MSFEQPQSSPDSQNERPQLASERVESAAVSPELIQKEVERIRKMLSDQSLQGEGVEIVILEIEKSLQLIEKSPALPHVEERLQNIERIIHEDLPNLLQPSKDSEDMPVEDDESDLELLLEKNREQRKGTFEVIEGGATKPNRTHRGSQEEEFKEAA